MKKEQLIELGKGIFVIVVGIVVANQATSMIETFKAKKALEEV